MPFTVAAFYHFFDFKEFSAFQQPIKQEMVRHGIKGSVLIAPEGMNATVAGTRQSILSFLAYLETLTHQPIEWKESTCEHPPFKRPKVRLKKETISLGTTSHARKGEYVEPKDWNALIADPDTIVLDTRNNYETHLGTFKNAIDPQVNTFKELPAFIMERLSTAKHQKIATFCTGGIRCEKLSGWLADQGFEKIYQLKGGILKYLEEIPESESRWQGECFVFDQRIAVGHGVEPSKDASMCLGCGHPLMEKDRQHPQYRKDNSCGFCATRIR